MRSEYRPYGSGSDQGLTIWSIALGVCVGSLMATAITWAVVEIRVRWELEQATAAGKQEIERSQRAIAQAQQEAALANQRAVQQREQLDAEQRRRLVEQQRVEYEAKSALQAEVIRKEAAWKKFYKPLPACVGVTASVECANEHIRAKRAFEVKFAAGEL